MNPNDSWASGASASYRNVPRSTSVDYEKETQNTSARRLAAPPRRNNALPSRATKPLSKSGSINSNIVPDSQLDEEPSQLENRSYQRGKSPMVDAINGVYQKVSFYMRARSNEPDNSLDHSGNGPQEDASYSYDQEEQQFQASQPTNARKLNSHRRRNISVDNKAYKPSQSDLEQSDSDFEDDGRKRRKKAKKGGPHGGPLNSLPVTQYDKRKRRKSKGGKGGAEAEGEGSAGEEMDDEAYCQSRNPILHIARLNRRGRRKKTLSTMPNKGLNLFLKTKKMTILKKRIPPMALLTNGPIRYVSLGLAMCAVWYILGSPTTSLQHYILGWGTSSVASPPPTAPPADFAEISARLQAIESTVFALSTSQDRVRVDLVSEIKSRDSLNDEIKKVFGDVGRVNTEVGKLKSQIGTMDGRLGTVDGSVGTLSVQIGSLGGDLSKLGRQIGSLSGQISTLEGRVEAGGSKGKDGVSVDSGALANLKKEIGSVSERLVAFSSVVDRLDGLRKEWESERSKKDREKEKTGNESRVRLQTLEDRMDTIAKSVDEALDLGRQSHGETKPWWASLPGKKTDSSIVIKTTDGQDISSLLSDLVSSTVIGYFAKDILGKPDYALYSGGARVIPSLTSPTYEIKPSTLRGSVVGMLTGQGYASGRPPVTGLHPETHNGHCWPFAGTHGQLGVALGAPVFVNEIVIEHVPGDVAFDLRSAPRDMEVWGVVEGMDNLKRFVAWREEQRQLKETEGEQQEQEPYPPTLPSHPPYIRLAKFSYDVRARNHIQVFPVLPEIKALGIDFGVVVLMVKNNWGMDDYTCIYRMRVHGDRLGEVPPLYDSRLPESSES
ncbi:hypothetical protein PLEOSDRAFT_1097832 [Pleurotus ostreatus PC15]|uniref:SUN domain-containing protein n=1 Tax=Pleurotus ostreatus (strain PC15) TaxID=1137138 RepID=A0A067NKZ8_PLEO1|nr:hypothetical protein PLEOSDRAFT_1097832 [Pleurotus ostreatus PC15]